MHRWAVEVAHSWFNRFRKLLMRYEKLERGFLALHHLATAIIVLRKVPMKINGIVTVTIEAGKVDRCRHPSSFTTAIVFQMPLSVARCAGISDFSRA
jgi:hypothetical protein